MRSSYNKLRLLILVLLLAFACAPAFAQLPAPVVLNKKVSHFNLRDKTAAESLDLLGEAAGVRFTYKTDILPAGKRFNLSGENKTVGQILYFLFKDDYEYEERLGYIILHQRYSYYILSGYVADAATGMAIESAEISTLTGAFNASTDARGFFELKIPRQHITDYIAIRKDFYSDGFMEARGTADKELFIGLHTMRTIELPAVTATNTFKKKTKIAFNPLGNKRRKTTNFEMAGLFNYNLGNARNLQLAGAVNIVRGSLFGIQIAGVHNLVKDTTAGVQLSALINKGEGLVKGVQIAAVNHARKLKGLQIGVINIADSSDGYSLGLLNFVRNGNGYHHLSLYATDLMNTNISVKLGNAKLYSVLLAGANFSSGKKLYAAGWGLGHDFLFGKKVSLSAELNYQFVDAGSWDNRLLQFKSSLNIQLFKGLAVFGGPLYNRYADNQGYKEEGYKNIIASPAGAQRNRQTKDWIGWQAGITSSNILWTDAKRTVHKGINEWTLQLGVSPGIDPRGNAWIAGDLQLQKDFAEGIALRMSTSMNHRFGVNRLDQVYAFKAGLKINTQKRFYVAGDIGVTLNKVIRAGEIYNPVSGTLYKRRFIWSPSFGWKVGQRFDISARYENLDNPVFLRVGYTLWRSR